VLSAVAQPARATDDVPKPEDTPKLEEISRAVLSDPFWAALVDGNMEALRRELAKPGWKAKRLPFFEQTPLMAAVNKGDVSIVRLLLDHGASVDEVTRFRDHAIFRALVVNRSDILAVLLDAKPKQDVLDGQGPTGDTPLTYTLNFDNERNTELLINAGASRDAKDAVGAVPATLCKERAEQLKSCRFVSVGGPK
jgi:hypothetical protein